MTTPYNTHPENADLLDLEEYLSDLPTDDKARFYYNLFTIATRPLSFQGLLIEALKLTGLITDELYAALTER